MIGTSFGNSASSGGGNDADAAAFISAAAITGTTQQDALNQLVLDLKGTGSTTNSSDLWTKIYAAYPFCPIDNSTANAACYQWNLKSPLDTDAAFRLTFVNTPLYSVANGLEQNGSNNGYANTHFIENANMVAGNNGLTSFVTRYSGGNGYTIAAEFAWSTRLLATYRSQSAGQSIAGAAISVGKILTSTRTSSTAFEFYIDNVSQGVNNTSASGQQSVQLRLLCRELYAATRNHLNGATGFEVIHDGLTANEVQDMYDSITTYNTAIGR